MGALALYRCHTALASGRLGAADLLAIGLLKREASSLRL